MERPDDLIGCDGVRLRRWRLTDTEVALRIVVESIAHLRPWMPWATDDYGPAEAVAYLRRCEDNWESGQGYDYAIIAPDGEVVGSCGLIARIGPGGLEIGYWLHPDYTGAGIVTRAAAALTAEAFRIGADRVEIKHDVGNVRSGAVPRRLGFTEIGREPSDMPLGGARTGTVVVWRLLASAPCPADGPLAGADTRP